LAFAGIILIVLNLRPAITSLSPIYDQIGQSFSLTAATLGLLGMLPPLAFAFFGSLTPRLLSRLPLEKTILLAMALVCIGQVARSFSNDIWLFGITSAVSLAGMGIGNVLIPPVIKRYFPDRIGVLMSVYAAFIAVSAALPSLVANPITQALGWRFSTGIWSGLALVAMVPWFLLINGNDVSTEKNELQKYPAWRWPTAWAITVIFGVGVLNNYTMIAWLPRILTSTAGVNQATSGTMLSLYNLIGIPHGLLVPPILSRTRRPFVVIVVGVLCMISGYLGLIYLPAYAWVWIFPAGIGLMLVPIGLTLINLRSHTEDGATVLSGFTQGAGYLMAAAGPIAVGGLHSFTGNWTTAIWFLLITALIALGAGVVAAKPRFIEDS
jgi:CP family cyanate transporter-like MFS transporter